MKPDTHYMRLALSAAHDARGTTWPNPAVGCVLVTPAGNIIATACTCKGGRPHAETECLAKAGTAAKGATCYVTLEPCNHTSTHKPVSCTDALIEAGVARVVIAIPDPDPRVASQSIARLKQAGIDVSVGCEADTAYESHRGHITRVTKHRPFITLKLAHSKDGKIGLPDKRVAITGDESWAHIFALRGKVDAVMVGGNTARIDDPLLTDRSAGATHQPIRIVVSRHSLPASAKVQPAWLINETDVTALLETLYQKNLTHVLVEGGAKLAQSLIAAHAVDEAIFIEGDLTIGENGIPCPTLQGMTLRETKTVGRDIWRIYDASRALISASM